ncbi:hypothetical protein [Acidisoma sp. 7E03]
MPDTMIADRSIDTEIAAFNEMKAELEKHHHGKFVVVAGGQLQGTFDSLDNAAHFARMTLGEGPFLIRQVGVTFPTLPASVMCRPVRAA